MYLNTELMTLPLACSRSHLHRHTADWICLPFYPSFWINSTCSNSENLCGDKAWTKSMNDKYSGMHLNILDVIFSLSLHTVFFRSLLNRKYTHIVPFFHWHWLFVIASVSHKYSQLVGVKSKNNSVSSGDTLVKSDTQRNKTDMNFTSLKTSRHNAHDPSDTTTCGTWKITSKQNCGCHLLANKYILNLMRQNIFLFQLCAHYSCDYKTHRIWIYKY